MRYTNKGERDDRKKDILAVAATATTAAIAFNKSGMKKFASDLSRGFKASSKGIQRQTAKFKRKDYTAKNIKKILKNNFTDDRSNFKKAFNNNRLGLSNKGFVKDMREFMKTKNQKNKIINNLQDGLIKNNAYNRIVSNIDVNERDKKKLYQIIEGVTKNKSKYLNRITNDSDAAYYVDGFRNKNRDFKDMKATTIYGTNKRFNKLVEGTGLEKWMDTIREELSISMSRTLESEEYASIPAEFEDKLKNEINEKFEKNIIEKNAKNNNFFDDVVERAATVNDVINRAEANPDLFSEEDLSIIDEITKFKKKNKSVDIGNFIMDGNLRVLNGEMYSAKSFDESITGMKESFADTIPGKLFGTRSFLDKGKSPELFHFSKGAYDANISKLMGGDGLLDRDYFYIAGKTYSVKENKLVEEERLKDIQLISGVHGVMNVLNERLHGNFQYRQNSNKILDFLSFNTTGTNVVESFKSKVTKFKPGSDWARNSLDTLNKELDVHFMEDYLDAAKDVNDILGNSIGAPSTKLIELSKGIFKSEESLKVLEALNAENPLKFLEENNVHIMSGNLKTIMNGFSKDSSYAENLVKIGDGGGLNGLNVLRGDGIVKREILKSAMLSEVASSGFDSKSFARVNSAIAGAGIDGSDKETLKRMLYWSHLEEAGQFTTDKVRDFNRTAVEYGELAYNINNLFNVDSSSGQSSAYFEDFKNEIKKVVNESTSLLDDGEIKHRNADNGFISSDWVSVQRARGISPNKIIEDINNGTITDGNVAGFIKQFIGSRNNPEDITTATLLPFHMLNRLTTPLEKFGLGFDPRQTSSTGHLAANIFLKRVLPIAFGATALSYLNYEAENLTGTSFTESYQNFKANIGLGVKQIQSNIGIDEGMKTNRMYNPITNYLLGEYKDEEEYLDYLEYGSDPVRKGRYWSFGSTSEFRGGKIAYWEPNKLRQAHSNYKDIAIYGSSEEKWKHSLMPTLRHPLSPLRFLTNPYWVEDLNYEDRPYPVSAPLFAEGSPWAAVLNPTIGAIIKPQIQMHRDDMRNAYSSNSIIQEINRATMANAAEGSVIRLDDNGMTPVGLTPKGMTSLDSKIVNMNVDENGNIDINGVRGADFAESLAGLDYAVMPGAGYGGGGDTIVSTGNATIDAMGNGGIDPNNIIAAINRETLGNGSGSHNDVITTERARMYTTPFREHTEDMKAKYINSLYLRNAGDMHMTNAFEAGKELTGMYGFLFEQIMPSKRGYRMENAGQMTSFSRGFWDANIGGVGGDFMEIARRFFPHENHNIENINPLKNTQPLWLPERFQTGDPYTSLPKGEARLPGRGYEALNDLHSDQYGRYGAFDRFKILADVSPSSEEYKIWKKIAKEEVQDPRLRKQMKVIEKQAESQIKEHDFYDYRFLTKDMTEKNAVVDTVNNDGTFTVIGDEKTYAVAGLKIDGREGGIHNYLQGGMDVKLRHEDHEINKYRVQGNYDKGKPPVIAAIVENGGENIGASMWHAGDAEELDSKYKSTLADNLFAAKSQDIAMGHVWEAIGHMRLPYIHNKFLRINSPMEAYKSEQVYGNSYATWDHPIEGFIKPAFREAWSKGPIAQAIGVGTWAVSEYARTLEIDSSIKKAAHGLFALTNPAAFAGGMMGALPRMSVGSMNGIWNAKNGARVGAIVGVGGYALANLENPIMSTFNFAALGAAAFEQLAPEIDGKVLKGKQGAVIGAVAGFALSQLKNPDFKLSNWKETYIPEHTKEKWDIEEYFDRLSYEKYKMLFEEASEIAKQKEGVDVQKIYNAFEYNRDKNDKKAERLDAVRRLITSNLSGVKDVKAVDETVSNKINSLSVTEQYFKAGEWTKAAVAYKKAMDTTIHGLSRFSSESDVLRALPKYDRDFFLEFAKERDPKEREKILRYVSPYKAKALKALWGEEVENERSNFDYFTDNKMPGLFWSGWNPKVDLEHVKMKTIENEGMLLSDFGMYESAKNEPAFMAAPTVGKYNETSDAAGIKTIVQNMIGGVGLKNVDISVNASAGSGLSFIANITNIAANNTIGRVESVLDKMLL